MLKSNSALSPLSSAEVNDAKTLDSVTGPGADRSRLTSEADSSGDVPSLGVGGVSADFESDFIVETLRNDGGGVLHLSGSTDLGVLPGFNVPDPFKVETTLLDCLGSGLMRREDNAREDAGSFALYSEVSGMDSIAFNDCLGDAERVFTRPPSSTLFRCTLAAPRSVVFTTRCAAEETKFLAEATPIFIVLLSRSLFSSSNSSIAARVSSAKPISSEPALVIFRSSSSSISFDGLVPCMSSCSIIFDG